MSIFDTIQNNSWYMSSFIVFHLSLINVKITYNSNRELSNSLPIRGLELANKYTVPPSPPLKLQLRLCLGLVVNNAIVILPSRQRNFINQASKSFSRT